MGDAGLRGRGPGYLEHGPGPSGRGALREPAPHYEHSTIGYNYRLSNVLAAIGRGQLLALDDRVRRKREIFAFYRKAMGDLLGFAFLPEAPYGRCTRWLTVLTIDPAAFGADREAVRLEILEVLRS